MKRNQEWNALLEQAGKTPEQLETCMEQAMKRAKQSERKKKFAKPISAVLGTVAVFVLLVNCSTDFALAASRVPIVRELVEAVVLDPSLKAAITHEYVQLVDQTYTKDGVTLEVEYLMADPKNLSVFYRVYDEKERNVTLRPKVKNQMGEEISAGGIYGQELLGTTPEEKSLLASIKELFRGGKSEPPIYYWKFHVEDMIPEQLKVEAAVYQAAGVTELPLHIQFEVPLTIEPQFLKSVKTFAVGQTVSVLGQKLTIDTVEVYPTNTCITWYTAPENDSWLTYLPFYLTDKNGVRVDGIANGISGAGGDMFDGSGKIYLESAWYDTAESLTLHLDDAATLPKDIPPAILHEDGTLTGLPNYIKQDFSDDWYGFAVLTQKGTYHSNTDPFRKFVDASGKEGRFSEVASRFQEQEDVMHSGYSMPRGVTYPLELEVGFAPAQKLPTAIRVPVN